MVNSARFNTKRITKAQKNFENREKKLRSLGFILLGKETVEDDGSFIHIWGIKKDKYTKEIEEQLRDF